MIILYRCREFESKCFRNQSCWSSGHNALWKYWIYWLCFRVTVFDYIIFWKKSSTSSINRWTTKACIENEHRDFKSWNQLLRRFKSRYFIFNVMFFGRIFFRLIFQWQLFNQSEKRTRKYETVRLIRIYKSLKVD